MFRVRCSMFDVLKVHGKGWTALNAESPGYLVPNQDSTLN